MADETEKLIDLVHNCPYLYDTSQTEYKNIVKKTEKWNEIAGILNMSSETAKHKWKNLRDSYIKYMKYLKGSTGSAKKYQNWPWAANLEFLKDTVAPRATTSNVSVSQTHETSFTDEVEQGDSDSGILTPPTQMPPPKKTPKRKEVTDDVHAVINYLENKNNNKTHTKLDHIDHLFLSYAHTFKTFLARTQAILKMEMSQLFGKAELNEFDKHNSTLSSPVFSTTSSWSDVNSNEATDNDTGNDIQAINYSSVYTDGYPREADKITHSRSYPVHTQSAKDMYENVTMFIATQPKHNQ